MTRVTTPAFPAEALLLAVPAPALAPGYLTKLETVHDCGADIALRSLLDLNQFSDPSGEAERNGISSAAWPIFGLLWPSSRVLAGVMVSFDVQGRRVLEVGCGLALASLVLHRRGADITASDCHPLAAEFLVENLRLNHLPAMKYQRGDWTRNEADLGVFDVIIGSDVLYDREQPQALSQFIDRHAESTVEIFIVDPDRSNHPSFTRKMGVLGYGHDETRVTELPGGESYKGRVHRYRRRAFVS